MTVEYVSKSNGLYTVKVSDTFDSLDYFDKNVSYTVSQVYDYKTKEVKLSYATTKFMTEVPEDIKKKLKELLEFISKEF